MPTTIPRSAPPLLLLDDDDSDVESTRSIEYSSVSRRNALFSAPSMERKSASPSSSSVLESPPLTNHMRHSTGATVRRVKGPVNMAPPRRVPIENRNDDDAMKEDCEEDNASEYSSCSSVNATNKPPNPWKVDVHSEANRISFDFARARDGVVQKIEQLHRQATERFHRTHQKHDREVKRMKGTIQKLEKALQQKVEIESNVVEKVRKLGE